VLVSSNHLCSRSILDDRTCAQWQRLRTPLDGDVSTKSWPLPHSSISSSDDYPRCLRHVARLESVTDAKMWGARKWALLTISLVVNAEKSDATD
jgi:hypothetical protein